MINWDSTCRLPWCHYTQSYRVAFLWFPLQDFIPSCIISHKKRTQKGIIQLVYKYIFLCLHLCSMYINNWCIHVIWQNYHSQFLTLQIKLQSLSYVLNKLCLKLLYILVTGKNCIWQFWFWCLKLPTATFSKLSVSFSLAHTGSLLNTQGWVP